MPFARIVGMREMAMAWPMVSFLFVWLFGLLCFGFAFLFLLYYCARDYPHYYDTLTHPCVLFDTLFFVCCLPVYDVGVFLGKGAFGQIFKVTHKFGGAEGFALKYFKPIELLQNMPLHSYDDITYKVGEIKSLLLMRGVPNILQIREFFFNFQDIQNAPLGLVTELMRGEDLDKWMKGRASMTQGVTELTASEITRSLLNAILAMHKRGIVHRDLKVSNLRITVGDCPTDDDIDDDDDLFVLFYLLQEPAVPSSFLYI